jgi:hypothetical protein
MIVGLWVISIIISYPWTFYSSYYIDNSNDTVEAYCYIDRSKQSSKYFVATFTAGIIIIPTIFLSLVYVIIVRKLKKLNKSYFSHQPSQKENNKKNQKVIHFGKSSHSSHSSGAIKPYRGSRAHPADAVDGDLYSSPNSSSSSFSVKIYNSKTNLQSPSQLLKPLNSCSKTYLNTKSRSSLSKGELFNKATENSAKKFTTSTKNKVNDANKSKYCKNLITKRRQTITICLISLAFFFCQIPIKIFQIFNAFYEFVDNDDSKFLIINSIFLSSKFLFFLHGMSNPIIYNLMSTKFRKSFRNVIMCKPLNNNYSYAHKFFFKTPNSNKNNVLNITNNHLLNHNVNNNPLRQHNNNNNTDCKINSNVLLLRQINNISLSVNIQKNKLKDVRNISSKNDFYD